MIYSEKNTNFDLDKKIRRDLKDFEMSQNKKVIRSLPPVLNTLAKTKSQ